MASRFASVTREEIIQISFVVVYFISLFQYIKTTIHLSVGAGLALDIYLAASRLGKYPPLVTSTSVNSC